MQITETYSNYADRAGDSAGGSQWSGSEDEKAPMSWYELLNDRWRLLDLHSLHGPESESALRAFEDEHSIKMPTELRLYFQHVNGMSMRGGHDVDDYGFSFLPLAKVRTVGSFIADMGWLGGEPVGLETAFVFVDYLHWCNAYAFETCCEDAGTIYLLGSEKPKMVAHSMSEFAVMYLTDDPLLYQP